MRGARRATVGTTCGIAFPPRHQCIPAPQVEAYKRDLAALDESIDAARAAMKRFRSEFEALRVALLVDRMSKSSTVAALAERRRKLAAEQEAFAEAVDAAKSRAAAEEAAKWEAMCVRDCCRAARLRAWAGGRIGNKGLGFPDVAACACAPSCLRRKCPPACRPLHPLLCTA